MLIDRTTTNKLIEDNINAFSSEDISVYKFSSVTQDLYRQGTRTYTGPTTVKAALMEERDRDKQTDIGVRNEDKLRLCICRNELAAKFAALDERDRITRDDILKVRGVKYSIIKVVTTGSMFGGPNVIEITCKEYPDAPVT
tara:strand:- start:2295 stop:2717 length:423 start_codon:yes stop_codon:yes gene_type:complete